MSETDSREKLGKIVLNHRLQRDYFSVREALVRGLIMDGVILGLFLATSKEGAIAGAMVMGINLLIEKAVVSRREKKKILVMDTDELSREATLWLTVDDLGGIQQVKRLSRK